MLLGGAMSPDLTPILGWHLNTHNAVRDISVLLRKLVMLRYIGDVWMRSTYMNTKNWSGSRSEEGVL